MFFGIVVFKYLITDLIPFLHKLTPKKLIINYLVANPWAKRVFDIAWAGFCIWLAASSQSNLRFIIFWVVIFFIWQPLCSLFQIHFMVFLFYLFLLIFEQKYLFLFASFWSFLDFFCYLSLSYFCQMFLYCSCLDFRHFVEESLYSPWRLNNLFSRQIMYFRWFLFFKSKALPACIFTNKAGCSKFCWWLHNIKIESFYGIKEVKFGANR